MTVEESRALTVAINSLRFNPNLDGIEVQGYEIALANMRNRAQDMDDTGLTPEEVERMKEYMLPFTIQDIDRFREIMQAEKEGRLPRSTRSCTSLTRRTWRTQRAGSRTSTTR